MLLVRLWTFDGRLIIFINLFLLIIVHVFCFRLSVKGFSELSAEDQQRVLELIPAPTKYEYEGIFSIPNCSVKFCSVGYF